MSLIKKMRKHRAVYWAQSAVDEFGARSFAAPVEIKCRWDQKAGQFVNGQGFTMESKATVYVDRDMAVGDKLKLGEMDSNTIDNPLEDREAFEVQAFEKVANLKNTEYLRLAHL